ncbi:hypothetical protein B0I32_106234 [Nonomuraea fuscirosea]|uniref:Fibronectin type-III domain-containing protein n=1 Tax=Nonomuraea fuscirosea TaxID=1291556 RepID=A0A2T0N283_9ACTN|nr:fibronectin type III domain-containing protein [Nonomuraea fuscirosea]PRX66098.1 hypothetical protein B0I32_106234 [Nonomuraea fuscirosea]
MYELRLVAFAPNGPRLGLLPHPLSFEVGHPLNDVPAMTLQYSRHTLGAQLLAQPCEIALEWTDDGQMWTESPDARFLRIKRGTDVTDEAGVETFELPGYGWQLRKIVLFPGPAPLVDGKRAFTSATPGTILQTFLAEAQARGALPALDWTFTTTHDSAGQPWAKILTIYYQLGLDALTTLINLAEQSVIDFRMEGRTLHVYNADSALARDRTAAPRVDLLLGRDVFDAPDTGTLEDAANAVLIVGDEGFRKSYGSSAVLPWGRWENYIGQGGVSDEGTAFLLAEGSLLRAAQERVQHTREITPHGARWLPWRDYQPGDKIIAPASGGTLAPLRVRQITLTKDDKGTVGGNVVLNDRFLEQSIRLARRTAGIVGGSTASGGSGAQPAPPTPRGRTAAAPEGLIVDPIAYVDATGHAQGQITATWGPVLLDVNGEAVDIDSYELFMRENVVGAPWFLVATTEPDDTTATFSPLLVGEEYAFKVRATSQGVRGDFSDEYAVLIPDDVTPPPVPSAPTLTTRLGVIHVEWDGLGDGGEPMPADFHRARVWMQDPLNPGAAEVGYLQAAGSIVVTGQPYGALREFWLTAVDHAGNESAPSASVVIAAVQLVQGDAADESITTGAIVANAVTADKIDAGAVEAGHIAANAVTADKLEAVLTLATRIVAGAPAGARVELNEDGLAAFDASSQQTVSISSASGAVSIIGQLATGVLGRRIVVNPAGASDPEIRFYPGAGLNYARIWTDTEAAIRLYSGTSTDGTRRSEVIQQGDEWRMHMVQSSDGLAGGGYMFAQPDQLEVGFNDIAGRLNRWLFTNGGGSSASGYTTFRGTFTYEATGAGLVMFGRSLPAAGGAASSYFVGFSVTLQSTPRLNITADSPVPARLAFHIASPGPSGFTLRSSETASGTTFNVLLHVWAWRQHGVS